MPTDGNAGRRYVMYPAGGPMRVIEGNPNLKTISDLLGGAIPVPILMPSGEVAGWVRETCSTEGQPRNIPAGLALYILGRGTHVPILGPCVVTGIRWTNSGVMTVGSPEAFGPEIMEGIIVMSLDLERALSGADGGFSDESLDAQWAASTRECADLMSRTPIPDDYPHMGMRRAPAGPEEQIWRGVAAAYGDGRAYIPMPLDPV